MSLESGRHRRPRGQSGRGGFWLLAPRNVMLLAFAVGLLLLGLTTMSWHSSVLSALPSSGGATLERSSVTQLAATGGGSAGSIGGVAGRQLADNTASLDDRQRVVSDGKATLVPAKAGRGTRRVMLASHGRLQWYYPDTDTTQLLHEGGVRPHARACTRLKPAPLHDPMLACHLSACLRACRPVRLHACKRAGMRSACACAAAKMLQTGSRFACGHAWTKCRACTMALSRVQPTRQGSC